MTGVLITLGYILYVIVLLGALVIVPLGFPGTWLMVALTFIYSVITDFQPGKTDFWVLFFVIFMAVIGEVVEYFVGIMGGKKMKVTTGAIVASLAGGVIGAIVGVPIAVIGSLVGLLAGTFLGAWVYEFIVQKDLKIALQTSLVVFFSRVTALFVKTAIAFGMVIFIFIKTF